MNLSVRDLLNEPAVGLDKAWVRDLGDHKNLELASACLLVGRKGRKQSAAPEECHDGALWRARALNSNSTFLRCPKARSRRLHCGSMANCRAAAIRTWVGSVYFRTTAAWHECVATFARNRSSRRLNAEAERSCSRYATHTSKCNRPRPGDRVPGGADLALGASVSAIWGSLVRRSGCPFGGGPQGCVIKAPFGGGDARLRTTPTGSGPTVPIHSKPEDGHHTAPARAIFLTPTQRQTVA